jgi:hypothetical protein
MAQTQVQPLSLPLVVKIDEVVDQWKNTPPLIATQATYHRAIEALRGIQIMRREITAEYQSIKDDLNKTRRTVLDQEKKHLTHLAPTEEKLNAMIVDFETRKEAFARAAAERALERPSDTVLARVADLVETPTNGTRRTLRQPVVTDLMALCQAVCAGTIPVDAVLPNLPYLRKLVRSQEDLFECPGVRVDIDTRVILR